MSILENNEIYTERDINYFTEKIRNEMNALIKSGDILPSAELRFKELQNQLNFFAKKLEEIQCFTS